MRSPIILASIIALASSTSATAAGTSLNELAKREAGTVTTAKARSKPGRSATAKFVIGGAVTVAGLGLAFLAWKNFDKLVLWGSQGPLKNRSENRSKKELQEEDPLQEPARYDFRLLGEMHKEPFDQIETTLSKQELVDERIKQIEGNLTSDLKDANPAYQADERAFKAMFSNIMQQAGTNFQTQKIATSLRQAFTAIRTGYTSYLQKGAVSKAHFVVNYGLFLGEELNQLFFLKKLPVIYQKWDNSKASITYLDKTTPVTLLDPAVADLYMNLGPDYHIQKILVTKEKEIKVDSSYKKVLGSLLDYAFADEQSQSSANLGGLVDTFVKASADLSGDAQKNIHRKVAKHLVNIFPDSEEQLKPEEDSKPHEEQK